VTDKALNGSVISLVLIVTNQKRKRLP